MKNIVKQAASILLSGAILLFAGCGDETGKPQSGFSSGTVSGQKAEPVTYAYDPNENPLHRLIQKEQDQLYVYLRGEGICRIDTGNGNQKDLIVEAKKWLSNFYLHGEYLYFERDGVVGRTDKNGENYVELFRVPSQGDALTVRGNYLIIKKRTESKQQFEIYNIQDDPIQPQYVRTISSRYDSGIRFDKRFYLDNDESAVDYLFRENVDGSGTIPLMKKKFENYLVTHNGIFYFNYNAQGEIWKSDFNGENVTKLCNPYTELGADAYTDLQIVQYDKDWIYAYFSDTGEEKNFLRVNMETGQVQALSTELSMPKSLLAIIDEIAYANIYDNSRSIYQFDIHTSGEWKILCE